MNRFFRALPFLLLSLWTFRSHSSGKANLPALGHTWLVWTQILIYLSLSLLAASLSPDLVRSYWRAEPQKAKAAVVLLLLVGALAMSAYAYLTRV